MISVRLFVFVILYLLLNFCHGGQLNELEKLKILDDHNYARQTLARANNMVKLEWDQRLEIVASNYTDNENCSRNNYIPNMYAKEQYESLGGVYPDGELGLNWYQGEPTIYSDRYNYGAVDYWTISNCSKYIVDSSALTIQCTEYHCSQRQNFLGKDIVNGKNCSQTNGRWKQFTQVMWAATRYVGCGYSPSCGTLCYYVPAGNVNLPDNAIVKPEDCWGVGDYASKCPHYAPYVDDKLCSSKPNVTTNTPTTYPPVKPTYPPNPCPPTPCVCNTPPAETPTTYPPTTAIPTTYPPTTYPPTTKTPTTYPPTTAIPTTYPPTTYPPTTQTPTTYPPTTATPPTYPPTTTPPPY